MKGVLGIYDFEPNNDIILRSVKGLEALSHRGGEESGIALGFANGIQNKEKGIGSSILDILSPNRFNSLQTLNPNTVIGCLNSEKTLNLKRKHRDDYVDPFEVLPKQYSRYKIAVTMGGDIVEKFRHELIKELDDKFYLKLGNPTELVGSLLNKYLVDENKVSFNVGKRLYNKLDGKGTFALIAIIHDKKGGGKNYMITLNDGNAFEPFCFSSVNNSFVVSSESCSLFKLKEYKNVHIHGLKDIIDREFSGAEMSISSQDDGVKIKKFVSDDNIDYSDDFQAIYYGNRDSVFKRKEIHTIRKLIGEKHALYYLKNDKNFNKPDKIVPNPDSGRGIAPGLSKVYGVPVVDAQIKEKKSRTYPMKNLDSKKIVTQGKFHYVISELTGMIIDSTEDSIVDGNVNMNGSFPGFFFCNVKALQQDISYIPILLPSYKKWSSGRASLEKLVVQKAFNSIGDVPYNKTVEEHNKIVADYFIQEMKKKDNSRKYNLQIRYTPRDIIENIIRPVAFEADSLENSPIDYKYWPDWIKKEEDIIAKHR